MVEFEEIDPSQILVTAWADDDAIDWEASAAKLNVSPEDAEAQRNAYSSKGSKCLEAKAGQEITWFHFRLLTHREDVQVRTRYGLSASEVIGDQDIPLAKIEAMALEAARLAVVEIEGVWKRANDRETLPGKYLDAKGPMPHALRYAGEKIIRFSRLTEAEANF